MDASGYNLVSTVEREGLRLIAVVMGVDVPNSHFADSMKLYNWAFKQWAFKKLYEAGQGVARIPVAKGEKPQVEAVCTKPLGARVSRVRGKEEKLEVALEVPPMVPAPVQKGQTLGQGVVLRDGKEVERVPLVAGEEVARATLAHVLRRSLKLFFCPSL